MKHRAYRALLRVLPRSFRDEFTEEMVAVFGQDLTDPAAVSAAANQLTEDHPDRLVSLSAIIMELETEARSADQDTARELLTAAAAMRADGLGMGWIHFRVNSSQLQNAISRLQELGHITIETRGRGNRWVDARLLKDEAEVKPDRVIDFGSKEHFELACKLAEEDGGARRERRGGREREDAGERLLPATNGEEREALRGLLRVAPVRNGALGRHLVDDAAVPVEPARSLDDPLQ